jgi:seryl-tRNA synthetase
LLIANNSSKQQNHLKMAHKKSSAGVAGLQRQKQSLRNQLSKLNQKKRDKQRAEKLKREVEGLKRKLRSVKGCTTRRKRR